MVKKPKIDKKVFNYPIKTFKNSKDLIKMMLESDNNTLFILGEKTICKDEGRPKVELT
jgi:hypothetical protein